MTFDKYLESAKLNGNVKELMTKGLAVEFIQPWYTPLTTTPATTGIAVGGIGSTYTATPAGTTPVTGIIPMVMAMFSNAWNRNMAVKPTTMRAPYRSTESRIILVNLVRRNA